MAKSAKITLATRNPEARELIGAFSLPASALAIQNAFALTPNETQDQRPLARASVAAT
jgi:hypothetical protein